MKRKTVYSSAADQQEIDLLELFLFYMGKLPLLIAAAVCGALLSGLFTHFFIEDRYTASSRMYMVSASSSSVVNLSDLLVGTSLSNDYVELMKTRPVIEGVRDSLGLDYTYNNLLSMISLSVVPNTRIVKISVTSTDPVEAMDIANEMARISREHLPKIMEAPAPSIVETAIIPEHRSYPSMSRNVAGGTLAALALVMGVLTVIYLMDDTIQTSEELEKEFGIMPMSVIPDGMIEGLAAIDDESSRRRFRLPGLPMRTRRKEEFAGSWTSAGSVRTTEKKALPVYEPARLPIRHGEPQPQPWFLSAEPPEEPVRVPADQGAEARPWFLSAELPEEPVKEPVDQGVEARPWFMPAELPEEPVKELADQGAENQPWFLSAGKPAETAGQSDIPTVSASSEEPAWELRPARRKYKSAEPMWEIRPAGQDSGKTASHNITTYVAGKEKSRTGGYGRTMHRSKRHRRFRKKTLDFVIGTVFLLCAGLLAGLLIGQAFAPSAPASAPKSGSSTQNVPVVVTQSASTEGAAADGTVKNYTQIVVFMDNMQHIVEERYTAQDGSVVRNEKGYAIVRNQYDANGNLTRRSYFDENNNPVYVPVLGYSSILISYDELGNRIGETYYDTDGSPVVSSQ